MVEMYRHKKGFLTNEWSGSPLCLKTPFYSIAFRREGFSGYWLQLPNSELRVAKAKVYYFLYLDLPGILGIVELQ